MKNSILFCTQEDHCFIKMSGEIRHTLCTEIDTLLINLFDQEAIKYYVIDLRGATYLDSTTIGIFARIGRHMLKKQNKPVLVSTNETINKILNSMHIPVIADIVNQWENMPDSFIDLKSFNYTARQPDEIILQSHQELMQMNEENRKKFAGVVEAMDKKHKKKET